MINYQVRATVYDIAGDQPGNSDVFLADTNFWFVVTYPNASNGDRTPERVDIYAAYLKKVQEAKSKLFFSHISFGELAHIIEKVEFEIAARMDPGIRKDYQKEFRHNYPTRRSSVIKEIENAWQQVEQLGEEIPFSLCKRATDSSLSRLKAHALDGADSCIIENALAGKAAQIITDDADFITVSGIAVFTANPSALKAAKRSGRLKSR